MTSLITTKRTLEDFHFLHHWLQYENPSSWFPCLPSPDIDPCAIPSRPARSVLHFLEHQLDAFLTILLRHPTVATHELLWEFFMVNELQKDLIMERSKSKVENMAPAWEDEMPLEETSGSEMFFDHARGQVDRLRHSYQNVGRKAHGVGDALFCISPMNPMLTIYRLARSCETVETGHYSRTRTLGDFGSLGGNGRVEPKDVTKSIYYIRLYCSSS